MLISIHWMSVITKVTSFTELRGFKQTNVAAERAGQCVRQPLLPGRENSLAVAREPSCRVLQDPRHQTLGHVPLLYHLEVQPWATSLINNALKNYIVT
jgi:hypothetical protein